MSYTVDDLIFRLSEIRTKYGNINVEMCTETEKTGQVQQRVASVSVAISHENVYIDGAPGQWEVQTLILLPEGF